MREKEWRGAKRRQRIKIVKNQEIKRQSDNKERQNEVKRRQNNVRSGKTEKIKVRKERRGISETSKYLSKKNINTQGERKCLKYNYLEALRSLRS